MNLSILNLFNVLAALSVFFYATNRLSDKKWALKQPELWVHTLLVGSSLGVFLTSVWDMGVLKHMAEVMMNMATAVYLGVRAWRKSHQKPKLPFPKFLRSRTLNSIKGKLP